MRTVFAIATVIAALVLLPPSRPALTQAGVARHAAKFCLKNAKGMIACFIAERAAGLMVDGTLTEAWKKLWGESEAEQKKREAQQRQKASEEFYRKQRQREAWERAGREHRQRAARDSLRRLDQRSFVPRRLQQEQLSDKPTGLRVTPPQRTSPGTGLGLTSPLLRLDRKETLRFLRRHRADPSLKPFLSGGEVELFKTKPQSTESLVKQLRNLTKKQSK